MGDLATAVRERPILFSGRLVRAILEGRKSVTRRVVKQQPQDKWGQGVHQSDGLFRVHGRFSQLDGYVLCPYGAPGDRLWVRETHAIIPATAYVMSNDDGQPIAHRTAGDWWAVYREGWTRCPPGRWCPSIHMPRWASRISLEVTEVCVERLCEITDADAIAEGVEPVTAGQDVDIDGYWWNGRPVERFRELWNEINAPRGFGWNANPWVWVIRFRRVEATS